MDCCEEKKSLRGRLIARRKTLPRSMRSVKSRKIFASLFRTSSYKNAEKIALYYQLASEVETRPFLRVIMKDKQIFLPRVDKTKNALVLHRVRSLSKDLRKGAYAIMEPKPGCPKAGVSSMDLVIVPGIGFDKSGGRLGWGAGYYDRLLKRAAGVTKIGICFREQLVKKIPVTKKDVRMDRVIAD